MIQEKLYRETFAKLHASPEAKKEVLERMKMKRRRAHKPLRAVAIAAVMTAALMVMAGAADLATEGMLMGTLRQLWTDGTVTHYQVEDSRGDTIDITVTQAGEGSGDVSYSEGEVVVSGEMDGGLGTMTEITVTAGE